MATPSNPPSDTACAKLQVVVAVLTTGSRPETLQSCVGHLAQLNVPPQIEFRFLLIQNGFDEPTVSAQSLSSPNMSHVDVIAEPRRGIPPARNAALRFAKEAKIAWIAFIDDDAVADRDWLIHLTRPLLTGALEAVSGPQVPLFPDETPARLRHSKVYQERRLKSGTACKWAATNNVVFSTDFAEKNDLWFDETMTAGGSDKEFFLRFTDRGGRITWASEAIIREYVSPGRLSLNWIVQREWRKGATEYKMQSSIHPAPKAAAICGAKAVYYLGSAVGNLVQTVRPQKPGFVDAAADGAHALSLIAGLVPALRPSAYK